MKFRAAAEGEGEAVTDLTMMMSVLRAACSFYSLGEFDGSCTVYQVGTFYWSIDVIHDIVLFPRGLPHVF